MALRRDSPRLEDLYSGGCEPEAPAKRRRSRCKEYQRISPRTSTYRKYLTRGRRTLSAAGKRGNLDQIAKPIKPYDVICLQESDPSSLRSGFMNQTHYLAERSGQPFWSHQPSRRVDRIASGANCMLSRLLLHEVLDYPPPVRLSGRGALLARLGHGRDRLTVMIAHMLLGTRSRRAQPGYIAELLGESPNAILMATSTARWTHRRWKSSIVARGWSRHRGHCRRSRDGNRTVRSTTSSPACR